MIRNWMKHDLVSDSNCDVMNLKCQLFLRGLTNNVRLAISVGDRALNQMLFQWISSHSDPHT